MVDVRVECVCGSGDGTVSAVLCTARVRGGRGDSEDFVCSPSGTVVW